jgi:hypothetical protein
MLSEVLKIFGAAALIVAVAVGLALWGGSQLGRVRCESVAETMNREHQWLFLGGCFIRAKDGDWVPLNQYRKFGDEK